jgi:hypothetical protein
VIRGEGPELCTRYTAVAVVAPRLIMSEPSSRACKPVTAKLTPFSAVSGIKSVGQWENNRQPLGLWDIAV